MLRLRFLPALSAAVFLAAAPPAAAQCLGPDGLDLGPCCAPAVATLPTFPAVTLPGSSICWDNCNVAGQACTQVVLGAPVAGGCAAYTAALKVQDCNGNPLLSTVLSLDYTRTWDEFVIPGTVSQVFRFVVKADVAAATTSGPPCQVPSCLATYPTAFYHGYLDYASDCSGGWAAALVLYHGCDAYQHNPLLSSRPGSFHPGRSFALVAPHTTANPFLPVVLPAPGGPAVAEAIRQAVNPATLACTVEEPIIGGVLQPLAAACVCPFSLFPQQTTARHVDVVGACGSQARSVNVFPSLPWFENLTISIGTWTTTASYPGPEAVWVDEGTYLHSDACDPTGALGFHAQIKVGATTEGGFQAISASGLTLDKFTDLVNNFSAQIGTVPIAPPFVGHVMPTRDLVYTNSP